MPPTTQRRTRDHRATLGRSRLITQLPTLATYAVATLPILPALLINIELAQGKSGAWMTVAIGMVVLAAVSAEGARLAGGWLRFMCALLAAVLTFCNVLNAATSATSHTDQKSDLRRAMIAAAGDREKAVARQSQRREAQVRIAGEVAPATIEAEIATLTAANSGRWNATDQCSSTKITAEQSRGFCADVGRLTAKLAAARERDKIDAELSRIGVKADAAEPTPTAPDSYSANVSALLVAFGMTMTADRQKAITASRDWFIALGVELMASLGPMILVLVIAKAGQHVEVVPQGRTEKAALALVAQQMAEKPLPNPIDDPVYAFIATAFERRRGSYMRADEPWQMWIQHCIETGMEMGTQRAFGMAMGACYQRERNHNRPRYVNVAARGRSPVRLVASNS